MEPYPNEEELLRHYSSGYTEINFEEKLEKNQTFHFSTEYEKVVFENYGYSLKDAGFSEGQLKNKTILDYGCAIGRFYKYLTEFYGVSKNCVFGADVESDMLEKCRQLSANFYSINQIHQIGKRFDLITMWNVIEHIYNPKLVIEAMIGLLNDDGEILIETPMYGTLAKKLGADWSHFIVLEHINLFSREAIKKIFKDVGMQCISESSFGANLFGEIQPNVKKALDQIAKEKDFGATQVLRFKKI
jgi:2-polyprenyl-3-methyl-5-hydroxy-6-metoxy-1,4-benzoquinol methylase